MPYPVAFALAAATTAASTGLQMAAQAEQREAVDRARAAELPRQREYQRQANAAVEQSLAQSSRQETERMLDQATAQRQADYRRITAPTTPTATGTAVADRAVTTSPTSAARGAQAAQTAAWNNILGNAQARLNAYQDWGLGRAIQNQRTNEALGILSGHARGSANVLQGELQDASRQGQGLAAAGAALGAIGSVAGMYAATRPTPAYQNAWGNYFVGSDGSLVVQRSPGQQASWNRIVSLYE